MRLCAETGRSHYGVLFLNSMNDKLSLGGHPLHNFSDRAASFPEQIVNGLETIFSATLLGRHSHMWRGTHTKRDHQIQTETEELSIELLDSTCGRSEASIFLRG